MPDRSTPARATGLVAALLGAVTTTITLVANWYAVRPWTRALDTGSVFLGQTLPAFREWFRGVVPEWSDLLWGGFPLIGDCTTAALYPLHAIAYLATPDAPLRFFDVAFALHLGIFVAGSVVLVRRLGGSIGAAALAGVLAALAPFGHFCAIAFFPVFGAHAWWPWTLVAADSLLDPATPVFGASMALGWIALAAQVLVGVPEQATYAGVVAVIWLLVRRSSLGLGHRVLRAAVLGAGAGALAAPQLLPTVLLLPWTWRAETMESFQLASFRLSDPVQLFVAGAGVMNGVPAFLGVAGPILAAVALVSRRPGAPCLAGIGVVAFALSLGPQLGLYDLLHRLPPFDHFRNPIKLYALAEYVTVWLAALGADTLWRRRSTAARTAAVLLVVASLVERIVYLPPEIAALDYLLAADRFTTERYAELAELTQLRRTGSQPPPLVYDAGPPLGGDYARSLGALLDISSLHAGSVALVSATHLSLLTRTQRELLALLGVRYVLAPTDRCAWTMNQLRWPQVQTSPGACLFENPKPPARYELVTDALAVPSEVAMMDALAGRPTGVPIVVPPDTPPASGRGAVLLRSYSPGHATVLAVVVGAPAYVLARDSFAPGWSVTIDGRPAVAYPAAGVYFAVRVPARFHTIAFDYRAPGLRSGLAVAAAWSVVAVVAALVERRRRATAA
jgi:hypothetical protein